MRAGQAGRDALPAIERPVGGGAIRGIDEKVSVAPSTGAATLVVPIPLTGGRPDVDPQLALVYAAGSGEGAFGLGWSLELPSVRRRLDTGVPHYLDPIDATTRDSDVFTAEGRTWCRCWTAAGRAAGRGRCTAPTTWSSYSERHQR